MPRVWLCVSVDCECDKGPGWKTRIPLRFDGVAIGIGERLHPLLAAQGVKPTYLISPEVLRDARSIDVLRSLGGAELGTHLHGEMADPGAFVPAVTTDVQRDYPAHVERAKLGSLTASFRVAFDRAPVSFRAGRFGIGASTVHALEALGYAVESSVTPGVDWSAVSRGLSFVGAPHQPYRPDPRAPSRPGAARILEVPITTVPRAGAGLPLVGRLAGPRWLRPTWTGGEGLVATARAAIRRAVVSQPRRPVVLNAMLHNVEVVAGASPYAATDRAARRILQRLSALVAWARREGVGSVGLADVPEVLDAAGSGAD